MWMVRAGEGGRLIDEFRDRSIVAIGWDETENLSQVKNSEEIRKIIREKYPDFKDGTVIMSASQVSRFRFEFEKGDKVISYDPDKRIYLVGEIVSDYKYDPSRSEFHHIRDVKWLGDVDRDRLSASTRNTLGANPTIFKVGEDAGNEIIKLLEDRVTEDTETQEEELDLLKEDMISKAHEFIKDRILDLSWEEMQELVAGLLRGMGYKTIVSPKGPDRGKDIQASPDGLGLEEPRIKVEVKHRSGQIGAHQIRSFTGGLRPGDKGLYISTGGFTKDANYEADRSNIPITLIDSDMLVQLVIQYYDNFDVETKTLLPLIKIYWPS